MIENNILVATMRQIIIKLNKRGAGGPSSSVSSLFGFPRPCFKCEFSGEKFPTFFLSSPDFSLINKLFCCNIFYSSTLTTQLFLSRKFIPKESSEVNNVNWIRLGSSSIGTLLLYSLATNGN